MRRSEQRGSSGVAGADDGNGDRGLRARIYIVARMVSGQRGRGVQASRRLRSPALPPTAVSRRRKNTRVLFLSLCLSSLISCSSDL
jgi:hypothetical protein